MTRQIEDPILRQLKVLTTLVAVSMTDKDFSDHTQQKQIAILGKYGLRNKELTELFGITRQQVNNALAKNKKK